MKCPDCGKLISLRFPLHDCKPKQQPKTYRITRITDTYVWFRWDAYGPTRRGLSHRIPRAEFDIKYVLTGKRTCVKRDPSI